MEKQMRMTQSRLESKIGLGLSLRTRNASLEAFDYDKDRKVLSLKVFSGFPHTLMVKSHHTGKTVRFTVIDQHDKLFNEDQWDGEMQIYRPIGNVPNVDHLVLYHG